MYRYNQTLPGGWITLLGVLALSFLTPGWAAGALGLGIPHAHLLDWMLRQDGLAWLSVFLLYGLFGFGLLLGIAIALFALARLLMLGLDGAKARAAQAGGALATWLAELGYWLVRLPSEWLWDVNVRCAGYLAEQHELRRIYREDYASDFPSYRAFRRYWRALLDDEKAARPDPLQQAMRLIGLQEPFTRAELKKRYHLLIGPLHPDKIGPNELATQVNAANELILEAKGWK